MGGARLRWLVGVEEDLPRLKVKRWRYKANNRDEFAFALKEAKVLRGAYRQVTSKQYLTYSSVSEDEMGYTPDEYMSDELINSGGF
jgi:hypothetical protein